jgi:hypothetical protein
LIKIWQIKYECPDFFQRSHANSAPHHSKASSACFPCCITTAHHINLPLSPPNLVLTERTSRYFLYTLRVANFLQFTPQPPPPLPGIKVNEILRCLIPVVLPIIYIFHNSTIIHTLPKVIFNRFRQQVLGWHKPIIRPFRFGLCQAETCCLNSLLKYYYDYVWVHYCVTYNYLKAVHLIAFPSLSHPSLTCFVLFIPRVIWNV